MGNVVFDQELHCYTRLKKEKLKLCKVITSTDVLYIPSLNNLVAYRRSVFKGLEVIVKNQFPYGENEWTLYIFEPDCYRDYL